MPAIANPCPSCCHRCRLYVANFEDTSAADTYNGLVGDWSFTPNLSATPPKYAWRASITPDLTNRYIFATNQYSATGPYRAFSQIAAPRNVSTKVKFFTHQTEAKTSITYQVDDGTDALRVQLRVTTSDELMTDGGDLRHCGRAELWDVSDLLAPSLRASVPIPSLPARGSSTPDMKVWHTMRLCYNPDTGIASGCVTNSRGAPYWLHAKGLAAPAEPTDNRIWLEVHDFGGSPGFIAFDDFEIAETKNTVGDYGYGYGYGYGDSDHCPCCGGCERVGVSFGDPAMDGLDAEQIDCRIIQSGTATQSAPGLVASSGTTLSWVGSYSGVGGGCQSANTGSIQATFSSAEYGKRLSVTMAGVTASITLESAEGAGDGILAMSGAEPITITNAPAGFPITLLLCIESGASIASVGDKLLIKEHSALSIDSTPSVHIDGGTSLLSFELSFGCTNCVPDSEDPLNECNWCGGDTVPLVLAFQPHIPFDPTGFPDCNVCGMIHDHTFIHTYEGPCTWPSNGVHLPEHPEDGCEWQPGCDAGPDSDDVCLAVDFSASVDGAGHLILYGLVMLFSNDFTCRIEFEKDAGPADDPPDCQRLFSGGLILPFKEFSGGMDGGPCRLCGTGIESGPSDTASWYLLISGL